jgi:hypothetical protein
MSDNRIFRRTVNDIINHARDKGRGQDLRTSTYSTVKQALASQPTTSNLQPFNDSSRSR